MGNDTQIAPDLSLDTGGELYEKSGARGFGFSAEQFGSILKEVCAKYLPQDASKFQVQEFCCNLRVEELALARACAAGHERAWEHFLTRYREKLYEIAAYITKEASAARELADSLYADLYGTTTRGGQRVCKLASYTGRGSLEGWLRTVMAQEHVNRYRKQRRLVSLDEESEEGTQFAAKEPTPSTTIDPKVELATDQALKSLSSEDRFVLAAYFLDDRTLAEIGRTLGIHESTISRKLDKISKSLRKQILASLVRGGMRHRQAQEAMDVDVRDLSLNIRKHMLQEKPSEAFPKQEKGARASEGAS